MTTEPFYKAPKPIAITGGPGAGKTAILEVAQRHLCGHVRALPEASAIVLAGGFPRREGQSAKRALQRAIFHVQAELEAAALSNDELAAVLCNRGTLDGLAYWPGNHNDFFTEVHSTAYQELARYHAVIHLRVPEDKAIYGAESRSLREAPAESHAQARAIDKCLLEVWSAHPRRVVIDASGDFLAKIERTMNAIRVAMDDHDCKT